MSVSRDSVSLSHRALLTGPGACRPHPNYWTLFVLAHGEHCYTHLRIKAKGKWAPHTCMPRQTAAQGQGAAAHAGVNLPRGARRPELPEARRWAHKCAGRHAIGEHQGGHPERQRATSVCQQPL